MEKKIADLGHSQVLGKDSSRRKLALREIEKELSVGRGP